MSKIRGSLFFLIFLMCVNPIWAVFFADQTVSPNRVSIGDVVEYRLSVRYDEAIQFQVPQLREQLGEFQVKDIQVSPLTVIDHQKQLEVTARMQVFQLGEFMVPSQNLLYIQDGQTVEHELQAKTLVVEPILSQESQAGFRDIKPLMTLRVSWSSYVGFLLAGLLLLGAAGVGWWYYRQKKGVAVELPLPVVEKRPVDEVAIDMLKVLQGKELISQGKVRQHYFEFSEIMKQYFSGRYQQKCLEMTSEEVVGLLATCMDEQTLRRVSRLFQVADFSKFAKYEPSEDEHVDCFQRAFDIIDRTKLSI